MLLNLNWEAFVSKHAAPLVAALTTRREKMEETIAPLAMDELTEEQRADMAEAATSCRQRFDALKAEGDTASGSWKALQAPGDEQEYKRRGITHKQYLTEIK